MERRSAAKKLKEVDVSNEDVLRTTSDLPGLMGVFEGMLRKFRMAFVPVLMIPIALICCLCMGAAAAPGIYFFTFVQEQVSSWPLVLNYVALGTAGAIAYLIYGASLLFILPLVNFINPFKVKPFRGMWFSVQTIPWYFHNALTYVARYTFLEFFTPSPFNILFYRMMGMKIGKGVIINTTNISDPCLITLGDYVTIGGSATLFAHYGQKGYLIIAPVVIGDKTTIGLKASVMGGVTIGKNCVVTPHQVLLPKTELGDSKKV